MEGRSCLCGPLRPFLLVRRGCDTVTLRCHCCIVAGQEWRLPPHLVLIFPFLQVRLFCLVGMPSWCPRMLVLTWENASFCRSGP